MSITVFKAGNGWNDITIGSPEMVSSTSYRYVIADKDEENPVLGTAIRTSYFLMNGTGSVYASNYNGTQMYFTVSKAVSNVVCSIALAEGYEFKELPKLTKNTAGTQVIDTATQSTDRGTNLYTINTTASKLGLSGTTNPSGSWYLYLADIVSAAQTFTLTNHLTHCTSSISDGNVKEGNKLSEIRLDAEDGYHFDEDNAPYIEMGEKTITAHVVTDSYAYWGDIIVSDNVEIYGTAIEDLPSFYIEQNLTNCTSNIEDGKYEESSQLDLVLTANPYYRFEVVPDANGIPFNLNEDKTIATLTLDVDEDITINGEAEAIYYTCTNNLSGWTRTVPATFAETYQAGIEISIGLTGAPYTNHLVDTPYIKEDNGNTYYFMDYSSEGDDYYLFQIRYTPKDNFTLYGSYYEEAPIKLSFNLVGCTANYEAGNITKHSTLNIVLTPINLYGTFEQTPKAYMGGTWYDFEVNEEGTEATLTIVANDDISVSATATVVHSNITYNLTNVTISPNPSTIDKGDSVMFNIVPREGYSILKAPTITVGRNEPLEFVKADDEDRWIYYYESNGIDAVIDATAQYNELAADGYGYLNVYVVSQTDLDNLSKDQFFRIHTSTTSSTTVEMIDISKYILTLRCLYLDVPQAKIESIKYGGYTSSKGEGGIPTNIYVETSVGKIDIPIIYNNSIDFSNTVLALYLPFIGEVTLDTDRFMGQTLTLTYRTNIITGDTTAKVTSSNGIEQYYNGNLSFELPIHIENLANQNLDGNTHATDGFKPFLIVARGIPSSENEDEADKMFFGRNVDFEAVLNTVTGYSEIDNVELVQNVNMYKEDIDEIESILRSGVIL